MTYRTTTQFYRELYESDRRRGQHMRATRTDPNGNPRRERANRLSVSTARRRVVLAFIAEHGPCAGETVRQFTKIRESAFEIHQAWLDDLVDKLPPARWPTPNDPTPEEWRAAAARGRYLCCGSMTDWGWQITDAGRAWLASVEAAGQQRGLNL